MRSHGTLQEGLNVVFWPQSKANCLGRENNPLSQFATRLLFVLRKAHATLIQFLQGMNLTCIFIALSASGEYRASAKSWICVNADYRPQLLFTVNLVPCSIQQLIEILI